MHQHDVKHWKRPRFQLNRLLTGWKFVISLFTGIMICNRLKNKSRLQQDIKDISADLDRSLAKVSNIEKRQRTFDKQLSEEEDKYDRISLKLKEVLEERKQGVHQVFQNKQRLEELEEEYEVATKENKKLAEEVADLKDQITEGKKSMEEIDKAKKYLEKERNDLQKLLTQKEDLLEQLEAKTILFQLNLKKCKSDMESMCVSFSHNLLCNDPIIIFCLVSLIKKLKPITFARTHLNKLS